MKRNVLLILTVLMVFSFGLVNAQDMTVAFDGEWEAGKVKPATSVTWTIGVYSASIGGIQGSSNGFHVFLSGDGTVAGMLDPGPGFTTVTADSISGMFETYGYNYTINYFSADGSGADTVGFGGVSFGPPSTNEGDAWTITTAVDSFATTYLCMDSSYYPPGGAWLWVRGDGGGNYYPVWNGPYCYLIEAPENMPAVFVDPPASLTGDHCTTLTYQFEGDDPDPEQCDPPGDGSFSFSMVNDGGSGATISSGGMLSIATDISLHIGSPYTIIVHIEDACNIGSDHSFDVSFGNNLPTIDCGGEETVGKGNPIDPHTVTAADGDACDALTFSLGADDVAGTPTIDPVTGVLNYTTVDPDDIGDRFIEVCVTDGDETVCCNVILHVLPTEPFEVQIEKTHGTFQGGHELVDVYVNNGSEAMWGFDILIAYDASALSFQTAVEGSVYAACGWEYFTYRYGATGNCGNACPSGLLRVVGLAETNNGPNHPTCYDAVGHTLFTLDFLVTDDRTFECMYIPIRFYWTDCGDNAISYHELADIANPYSQIMGISRWVFEFEGMEITGEGTFPTYFGAPTDPCMEGDKDLPIRFVDFINGGVDIICADSIDGRGDLNMNGVDNEIADAVLYTNYFVYGIGVFEYYQAQVAASDVNADGLTLSVADLVYQIRIIVGDALPYPKLNPIFADVTVGNTITVDQPMGAAFIVIEGNTAPELLANNMELSYNYDADNDVTRALVYSYDANQTFNGEFFIANGTVQSIEMATYEGQRVEVDIVPSNFALHQNYPNPFNPTTVVSFDLAKAVNYSMTVYNITGQEIANYSDFAEAGLVEINVDGSSWASGIYFYKLNAGDFSETLKMVLVK